MKTLMSITMGLMLMLSAASSQAWITWSLDEGWHSHSGGSKTQDKENISKEDAEKKAKEDEKKEAQRKKDQAAIDEMKKDDDFAARMRKVMGPGLAKQD